MIKRNIFIIIAILTIFVCGLHTMEPAAAAKAKLIDSGFTKTFDNDTNTTYKTVWKTYQYNKNYIIVKLKDYKNNKLQKSSTSITLTKYNKKIIRVVSLLQGQRKNQDNYNSFIYYKATDYLKWNSTARSYYFNKIKPRLSN